MYFAVLKTVKYRAFTEELRPLRSILFLLCTKTEVNKHRLCCSRLKELTAFQLILASPFIGSDLCLPELSDSVSFLY